MRSALRHNPASNFVRPLILVSFLCLLCASAVNLHAQDFKTIRDGVEYAQVNHKLGGDPLKINLLRLDLKKVRLDVHKANDRAIGLETTSSIAKRKGAVAAINAGFFRLDNSQFAGDAAGSLVVDGELISESMNGRVALILVSFRNQTYFAEIEHLNLHARVYSDRIEFPEINGINREKKDGEVILYTNTFGTSTLTKLNGVEVIIDSCKERKILEIPATYCSGFTVREGVNNSVIPQNGFVLSIETASNDKFEGFLKNLKSVSLLGKKDRTLQIQPSVGQVFKYRAFFGKKGGLSITNGVPQLIKNGEIDITWEQEKAGKAFVFNRHPRTAVAKMNDGKFLMMTVDGRQPGVSVGMTLQELAEYLLSLGAVEAMNLDGGGSTTMFLDGKVVNRPSDPTGERKVSDVIIVTPRGKVVRKMH